jgi:pilus assembly protein CpaE
MEKIRVLIVDDNDETRDGTRRLLEYEDDIEVVDYADNGLVAIEKVKEHKPHVVLMDINMPVMDGLAATQRLQVEAPYAQIIIVSVQDDPNYMRKAIRAGAVDFVAKPISSDELAESIRQAYAKRPSEAAMAPGVQPVMAPVTPEFGYGAAAQEGQIISVLGPKGGAGKTTIAVNLGIGLMRLLPNKKVLIVDASTFFGDVGVFLNTRSQYSIIDFANMAVVPEEIDAQVVDQIVAPHESGVRLLVAPTNPGDAPPISMQTMINMLDYLKTKYDYVIVDTSTTFDDVLAGVIQGADLLVLVTEPTMPAVKDTRIMFGELQAAGFRMANVLLVVNKLDRNSKITAEQISNYLKHPVAAQIPVDPAADEALFRSAPLVTLDSKRVVSVKPLTDLVQSIKEHVETGGATEERSQQPRRGGLFGGSRG